MATVEERLAVLETENKRQSEDVQQILSEIKAVTEFIYDIKPRVEHLEGKNLPARLTQVETRQKIHAGIAIFVAALAASKEWISELIFS